MLRGWISRAAMVGGPRRRRFFWGKALSNHTTLAKMTPKPGPGGGWNLGQTGREFFLGCLVGEFWGVRVQHCFQGRQLRLWHGEAPAKPGFKDCRVVRARVLDSVWGMRWDERGRVAPKLAGFQPRRHAHPVQSCQNRGHAMAVDPLQLTGKIALLLMASRGRKGECGKEEGLGTRRWFHAVRVSGS